MNFRELRRTLKSKLGAEEDKQGDHIYYYLTFEGLQYRVGKISRSARGQVQDFIILNTARRLRLDKREFLQFVDCTIDRDGHTRLWQERPHWPLK